MDTRPAIILRKVRGVLTACWQHRTPGPAPSRALAAPSSLAAIAQACALFLALPLLALALLLLLTHLPPLAHPSIGILVAGAVTSADLEMFSPANTPEDDTSTAAGARSTTSRPTLDQFSASAQPALASDGADTRNATVRYRDGSGVVQSQTLALNGTTAVLFTATDYILDVTLASADASRTVTVRQGNGGTIRATITPNETRRHIAFIGSASSASQKIYYTLHYWRNKASPNALLSAQVRLTADPSAIIRIGIGAAKGDLGTLTNRLTAPGGITFVDDNVAANVPTGNLGSSEHIGVYVEMTLAANAAALKSSFTTTLSGNTTA